MNKIKYILDLTNIKLPENVKNETGEIIKRAEEKAEKKGNKKAVLISVSALIAFAALAVVFALVLNRPEQHGLPDVTDTDTLTETTGTDAPDVAADGGYYVFNALYTDYFRYDIFKTAITLIKPYENVLVTAADLSPLYTYFGESDGFIEPTADELCETFFAYYEPGCVIHFDKIPNQSSAELYRIKSSFQPIISHYDHIEPLKNDEIILLTAKNGTFEYLLTLPVQASGKYSFYSGGKSVGTFNGGKYKFSKQYIETAAANIYKIRFEAGLPVIYAKYTLPQGSLVKTDNFISQLRLTTENTGKSDETVISARFSVPCGIVEFTNTENDMIDPVYTSAGEITYDRSLCDYPYYFPIYDNVKGYCSRKTVCEIINKFGLQWFIPMYVTETNDGICITGDGIVTGESVMAAQSAVSSTLERLYGTAYENGVYTSFFNIDYAYLSSYSNSTSTPDFSDPSIGLCYLPDTCDTPYFDKSYFNEKRTLMSITVTPDGDIIRSKFVNPDAADLLPDGQLAFEEFEPEFITDYLYIKDKNDRYFPARPFDIKYLPLLCEDIKSTPELFSRLGLSMPEYVHLNDYRSDLQLGHREISVLNTKDLTAYEEIDGYIIDMSGCVCGIANQNGVYMFTTVYPCFDITVKAQDGYVTYTSYSSDISAFSSDNTFKDWVCYISDGSLKISEDTFIYLMYHIGETSPVIEFYPVIYDEQIKTYETRASVMKLPDNEIFGIRSGDSRVYRYYPDVIKTVKNGKIYWECFDDYYAYGYFQYADMYGEKKIID